jgi:hypothetical protein
MSYNPCPPVRLEKKYISKPSDEKLVGPSSPFMPSRGLLTIGPRFVGLPKVKSAFTLPTASTIAATIPTKTILIFAQVDNFITHLPFCLYQGKTTITNHTQVIPTGVPTQVGTKWRNLFK